MAKKKVTAKITPEDLDNFVNWDTSFVWDAFPPSIDVLTLHGLSDKTVPPYVHSFSRIMSLDGADRYYYLISDTTR